jgi:ribosome biogenesis GTPase / thiamine phosphate phosphatase
VTVLRGTTNNVDLLDRPTLIQLGWSTEYGEALAKMAPLDDIVIDGAPVVRVVVGRVIAVHRGRWTVASPDGLIGADLLGIFRLGNPVDVPGVGDWVRVRVRIEEDSKASAALSVASAAGRTQSLLGGTIEDVVQRRSVLVRKTIGGTSDGQVIAANVDLVLITIPLDEGVNLRRIERQLTVVWESGAKPILIGTKTDVAEAGAVDTLHRITGDVHVICTSTITGEGFSEIAALATVGVSLVLLGTSGAGKSTIVNELLGTNVMATQTMGTAGKGRHTTTHRELLVLPSGALLIDTPGMRELGLWMSGNEDGVAATFAEVDEVAESCRFSDCGHAGDAGCAIAVAIADGSIDAVRVEAWRRLKEEQEGNTKRAQARQTKRPRR